MSAVAELISPQEYLEIERKSEVRHEYIDGRMVEMTGASENHNKITGNIIFVLKGHFRGRSGDAYSSDMRVRIPSTGRYTYPDVVAISDRSVIEEDELDVLLNPAVIFEVLSESTANYDRGEKFQHYRTIETLQEYLMVSQSSHHVEHYIRQPDGGWLLTEATRPSDTIHLPTISCDLPMAEVYHGVEIESSRNDLNGQRS